MGKIIKTVPNILTVLRLVLTGFLFWMICVSDNVENRTFFLDVAFVFFVITGLTDIVDGYVARRFDATSKFGRIVDPLADKILICGSFVCFAIIGRPHLFDLSEGTLSIIHWLLVAILIIREAMVTVIRQYAEDKGIKFPASVYGKLKMFAQSFGVGTVLVKMNHLETALWANWFTAVVFIIIIITTVVSGLEAVFRLLQAQKANCED
ncbi:MAG: CDP-alcohol phosphatidyltransferase family protein [Sedimentisphaeraceae bacterium JB056]